jgi:hypothetical protein
MKNINEVMDCLSNITILKSRGGTILPKFIIHNIFFNFSNAKNVEKNTITRRGRIVNVFDER